MQTHATVRIWSMEFDDQFDKLVLQPSDEAESDRP